VTRDNSNLAAKVEIRCRAKRALGGALAVLDLYCGEGHMYRACYHDAAQYLGVDDEKVHDAAECLLTDNLRYVAEADLSPFNLVDCDAYGSPWRIAMMASQKLSRRPFALVLTDGQCNKLRFNMGSRFTHAILGIPRFMRIPGLRLWYKLFLARAIRHIEHRTGTRCRCGWHARNKHNTHYVALIFDSRESA